MKFKAKRWAVFLDRDGTINFDSGHIIKPEEIRLLPGAARAIAQLNRMQIPVMVISNQSIIARGWATSEQVDAVNQRLNELLKQKNAHIDAFYYCPHYPDKKWVEKNPRLKKFVRVCNCRKPRPGLILKAARELGVNLKKSVMIGNHETDVLAGKAAGCRTILIAAKHSKIACSVKTVRASSLLLAVKQVLGKLNFKNKPIVFKQRNVFKQKRTRDSK